MTDKDRVDKILGSLGKSKHGPWPDPLVRLIRAERRACMQVVREYRKKVGRERPEIGYGHILDACDDILKALVERGKA